MSWGIRIGSDILSAGTYISRVSEGVYSTKSGLLVCDHHDTAWCNHIESAIKISLDSESIFRDYLHFNLKKIEVPVFPTVGIFGRVSLDRIGSTPELLNVYINAPLDANAHKEKRDERGDSLGILCHSEGRLSLRGMILDWILSAQDPEGCHSNTHNYIRKAEFMRRQEQKALVMQDKWCMYWYKKCTLCLVETGADLSFDPDLIPPRER